MEIIRFEEGLEPHSFMMRSNMNTVPLKLAVLDCDGTIVDESDQVMTTAFECNLAPPKPEEIIGIVGLNLADAMDVLLQGQKPERLWSTLTGKSQPSTVRVANGKILFIQMQKRLFGL